MSQCVFLTDKGFGANYCTSRKHPNYKEKDNGAYFGGNGKVGNCCEKQCTKCPIYKKEMK